MLVLSDEQKRKSQAEGGPWFTWSGPVGFQCVTKCTALMRRAPVEAEQSGPAGVRRVESVLEMHGNALRCGTCCVAVR